MKKKKKVQKKFTYTHMRERVKYTNTFQYTVQFSSNKTANHIKHFLNTLDNYAVWIFSGISLNYHDEADTVGWREARVLGASKNTHQDFPSLASQAVGRVSRRNTKMHVLSLG